MARDETKKIGRQAICDKQEDEPLSMPIQDYQAIDVHAHCGPCKGRLHPLMEKFTSWEADEVLEQARKANTELTIISSLLALFPRIHNDAFTGNQEIFRVVTENSRLLQWVIVDPRDPRTYDQAAEMLQHPKCVGIKIHPEEHGYPIAEHGRVLFEFAARHRAIVITHSGEQKSLPEDFVPFADRFPEVTLILAHLGCGWDGDPSHQVRAIQKGKRDNIYVDTSSAQSITPNLIEWAVQEIGADRILYGTDSPLYFAPMQRARIDHAGISDREKRLILRDNAVSLLNAHGKLNRQLK